MITASERAAIDAFIAERGVTKIPTGQSGLHLEQVWCPKAGRVISKDPEAARRVFRNYRTAVPSKPKPAPKPRVKAKSQATGRAEEIRREAAARKARCIELAPTHTGEEVAAALGVKVRSVYDYLRGTGVKCKPAERAQRGAPKTEARRAQLAEVQRLAAEGLIPREIAARVGLTAVGVGLLLTYHGWKPAKPALTPSRAAKQAPSSRVIELAKAGKTRREIMAETGLGVESVFARLRSAGLAARWEPDEPMTKREAQAAYRRSRAVELRASGMSSKQIAAVMDTSPRVVRMLLAQADGKRRPKWRKAAP